MSKKEFATVEEAVKYLEGLEAAHKAEIDAEKAINADLRLANENITKELDEAKNGEDKAIKEVSALSEQLQLQTDHGESSPIVSVGKAKFKLVGKSFNVPGHGVLTAEELSKNEKALAFLVKIKSGVLISI